MRSFRWFGFLLAILGVWLRLEVGVAEAAGSCTAVVSPVEVLTNADTNFAFAVTNAGGDALVGIKIVRPSSNFNLENYGVSGWSVSANNEYALLTGGSVAAGATLEFNYHGISGATEADSADWQVYTYDGSGEALCTGTLGVAIVGEGDVLAPEYSDVVVSSITSSSALITWVTNEASTTVVEYTLVDGESGTVVEDTDLTTLHAVALSGLSSSTNYYYYFSSADETGNFFREGTYLFTTAAAAVTSTPTPTPTVVTTTTTTTTTTATPTPVVYVDRVKPVVTFEPEVENPYEEPPEWSGTATDNIGVTKVQYSIDGGINWSSVEEMSAKSGSAFGGGGKSVSYVFTPDISQDGNYEIVVRALDSRENEGVSEKFEIVIDRLPPRVGASLLSIGPYALLPNSDGVIVTQVGIEERISLSAVGGPTSIDILASKMDSDDERMFSLGKSSETGLWTGTLYFSQSGLYELMVRGVDGAGNKTERSLGMVMVVGRGSVDSVREGEITVYTRDSRSMIWTEWDAKAFGQNNPQELQDDGGFAYYLPAGTYYLTVESEGYPKLTSEIFRFDHSTPLNPQLVMQEREYWEWGPIKIPKPTWLMEKAKIVLVIPPMDDVLGSSIVGSSLPEFELNYMNGGSVNELTWEGRRHVITMVTSWSPQSIEQIALLEAGKAYDELPILIVAGQETGAKMRIFLKRGGYEMEVVADPYGELVEALGVTAVPTHYLVDSDGIVQKVVVGVLTGEEIISYLSTI